MSRDTQFAGFAKLLLDELPEPPTDDSVLGIAHAEWREQVELIIARRAYDLVEHAIEHMKPYIYGEQVAGQESVSDVPDMTEWPEED